MPTPSTAITTAFLACSVLGAPGHALAQAATDDPAPTPIAEEAVQSDAGPTDGADDNKWRVDLNSWIWAMGIHGEVGARGRTANVSANFVDIVEDSDNLFAIAGRLEIGYDRFAVFVDGLYADIGVDGATGPAGIADIDVEIEQTLIDFGLMYRAFEWEPEGSAGRNPRSLTFDAYAGGRYSGIELKLSPAALSDVSRSEDWIDPIIGGRFIIPMAEHWHMAINGDIGGFGVESDLTWSMTTVFCYDFTLFGFPSSLSAGYRAVAWDYTADSEAEFTWDIIMHGVIIGFAMEF
jgi:hypothetical protein